MSEQAPHGIIVFGTNGAGKTTLARELARILGCKHMDIEDYAFAPSDIPYANQRPRDECRALMRADIELHRRFVLSACRGDFGSAIEQYYKLAVYLSAPQALRMQRIEQRGYEQHGDRVRPGGDMHAQQLDFLAWANARPLSQIDEWAQTLTCPVIRVDGREDWRITAQHIKEKFLCITAASTA